MKKTFLPMLVRRVRRSRRSSIEPLRITYSGGELCVRMVLPLNILRVILYSGEVKPVEETPHFDFALWYLGLDGAPQRYVEYKKRQHGSNAEYDFEHRFSRIIEISSGGGELPPIKVRFHTGNLFLVTDGFHRLAASRALHKETSIECELPLRHYLGRGMRK